MEHTLTELREAVTLIGRTVSRRNREGAELLATAEEAWMTAARAEYAPTLNDAQWHILYGYAYQEGHSGGYQEIENCIIGLADFAQRLIQAN